MPRHERLRKADLLNEVGHRRVATREPLHDPQPVDVGEGLVERPQGTQLVGRVDDRGDRRP